MLVATNELMMNVLSGKLLLHPIITKQVISKNKRFEMSQAHESFDLRRIFPE